MKVRYFKMWKWLQTLRQGKWLNKKLSWALSTASPLTPPSVSMCNLNLSLDRRKGRIAPTFLLPAPSLCGNSLVGVCDISNWAVTFQGHSLGLSFPIPAQFTCFWVKSSRKLIFVTHFPPYEPSSMEGPPCALPQTLDFNSPKSAVHPSNQRWEGKRPPHIPRAFPSHSFCIWNIGLSDWVGDSHFQG